MAFQQKDPFSWASEFADTQHQRAAQEQSMGQNALMNVFAAEARRQAPWADLPVDMAKQQNQFDLSLRNDIAFDNFKTGKQRRYGGDMSADGAGMGATIAQRAAEDLGIPLEAAAGLAGNLAAETGDFRHMQEISPLVPGSRGGFGWAQWTGPRRREFEAYAAQHNLSPSSNEANYGFLIHEIKTKYPRVLAALKQARTPDEAAMIVERHYLMPGIPNSAGRLGRSRRIYEQVSTSRNKQFAGDFEYDRRKARGAEDKDNVATRSRRAMEEVRKELDEDNG